MARKLAMLGLAATLVAAVAVGPAQAGSTKSVKVNNNAFSPRTVAIEKGDKVRWTWQGGVPHNVKPANGKGGSKTSSKKGYRFTKSFTKAGTFRYICTVHPKAMRMSVKVR